MAEKVFLSNQKVSFDTPIFTENFDFNIFHGNLTQKLEKPVKITDDEGVTITRCNPQDSHIRVNVMKLFKTPEKLGVIILISSPVVTGTFFYIQGEKHITLMIDPCVENVNQTISGYSFKK